MAEVVEEAFAQARRYELFMRIKSYMNGYLIWSVLGFLGSLASYLLEIFGEATGISNEKIGFAHGGIWTLVIGTAAAKAFLMDPEDYRDLSERYNTEKYSELMATDQKTSKGLSIAWIVSWTVGFSIIPVVDIVLPIRGQIFLVSIVLSLALGNLSIYAFIREATGSLFIGLILIAGTVLVAMVPFPFQQLVVGFVVAVPYYISGMYLKLVVIPRVLKR